jgi:hypothetical protein
MLQPIKENDMRQNIVRNPLLAIVALLLLFNLVLTPSAPVHAAGKIQYKAVAVTSMQGPGSA